MNKRNQILILCILSIVISLGCAEVAKLQATATPESTPTTQPTITPEPTATSMPGWKKFEGNGIEIWLPESYVGGDISKDIDLITEKLRELGPEYESFAKTIEQNPSMYTLWAYDSDIRDSNFLTNMGITHDQVLSVIDIDTYLDAAVKQLPASMQVIGRSQVTLNGHDARKMLIEATLSNITVKEVMYAVKNEQTIWLITFASGPQAFEGLLPDFEQSANTFLVKP